MVGKRSIGAGFGDTLSAHLNSRLPFSRCVSHLSKVICHLVLLATLPFHRAREDRGRELPDAGRRHMLQNHERCNKCGRLCVDKDNWLRGPLEGKYEYLCGRCAQRVEMVALETLGCNCLRSTDSCATRACHKESRLSLPIPSPRSNQTECSSFGRMKSPKEAQIVSLISRKMEGTAKWLPLFVSKSWTCIGQRQ